LGASPPSEKVAAPSEYNKKEPTNLAIVPLSCSFDAENMKYTLLSIWQNDIFSPHKRKGANGVTFTNDTREQLLNNSIFSESERKTRCECVKIEVCRCASYSYTVPRK
jgi:hypothetical protein